MSQSCFTPEQEARIAEIVRDTLKAIERERLDRAALNLERFIQASSPATPPERLQQIVLDAYEPPNTP